MVTGTLRRGLYPAGAEDWSTDVIRLDDVAAVAIERRDECVARRVCITSVNWHSFSHISRWTDHTGKAFWRALDERFKAFIASVRPLAPLPAISPASIRTCKRSPDVLQATEDRG